MSSARGLSRPAVWLLESMGTRLWGFPPRLMAPIVEQLGPARALYWFATNMPRYERTLKALGPIRTHLICVAISLYNGCPYCTTGHAYAMELVYFQQRDRLFPLDAASIAEWVGRPHGELRAKLRDLLQEADLHVEVLWVDLALSLAAAHQGPMDREEARVAHLVRMFAVLNAVGIAGQVPPDEAHDPINKNVALKDQVAKLRAG